MKKFLILLLTLPLLAATAAADGPRTAQVFDTTGDAGKLTIRFLWMGEQTAEDKPGDSMILTSPDGKVMVLDAGHPDAGHYTVEALEAMGVTKIDYLVASHPHIDHIGGFPRVMDKFEIGAMYTSPLTYESSSYYRAYLEAAERHGVEHIFLSEGDVLMFGEHVKIEVFNPPKEITYPENYPTGSTQFINNHSLALKLTYGDSTILLCGDLYKGAEEELVKRYGDVLKVDVMKANHHGAGTSSASSWRKTVDAPITVITSDTIEDLSLAKKFAKGDKTLYHTLLDGSICMQTAGDGAYTFVTEQDRTTTMFD